MEYYDYKPFNVSKTKIIKVDASQEGMTEFRAKSRVLVICGTPLKLFSLFLTCNYGDVFVCCKTLPQQLRNKNVVAFFPQQELQIWRPLL